MTLERYVEELVRLPLVRLHLQKIDVAEQHAQRLSDWSAQVGETPNAREDMFAAMRRVDAIRKDFEKKLPHIIRMYNELR